MPEKATTPAGADGARQGITKIEAMRQALAELGRDARLAQMRSRIQERFGIDMTTNHISDARIKILRQQASKATGTRKPAAQKPVAKKEEPKREAHTPQGEATQAAARDKKAKLPLDDILAVKELVRRHGAEPLRVLINAFAK